MKEIKSSNGKLFIIDDEDFDLVSKKSWHVNIENYVTTTINRRTVGLHRIIMKADELEYNKIDHVNGNPLDNTRKNLRNCNNAESSRNRSTHKNNKSGFKGVSFDKDRNKFAAYIVREKGRSAWRIGRYKTIIEAIMAYDGACKFYHKEFSRPNFKYGIG